MKYYSLGPTAELCTENCTGILSNVNLTDIQYTYTLNNKHIKINIMEQFIIISEDSGLKY